MNNGEANIDMREAPLKNPIVNHLAFLSTISKLAIIMAAYSRKTAISKPNIFICQIQNKDTL